MDEAMKRKRYKKEVKEKTAVKGYKFQMDDAMAENVQTPKRLPFGLPGTGSASPSNSSSGPSDIKENGKLKTKRFCKAYIKSTNLSSFRNPLTISRSRHPDQRRRSPAGRPTVPTLRKPIPRGDPICHQPSPHRLSQRSFSLPTSQSRSFTN